MSNVNLSSGIPETVLNGVDPKLMETLEEAISSTEQVDKIKAVLASEPTFLDAWSALGARSNGIEAYAYYRVGYHRGLDLLRASGWKGSGFVRWVEPANRGFLSCLNGLRQASQQIGDEQEAQRCEDFLRQLDPETDFDTV